MSNSAIIQSKHVMDAIVMLYAELILLLEESHKPFVFHNNSTNLVLLVCFLKKRVPFIFYGNACSCQKLRLKNK